MPNFGPLNFFASFSGMYMSSIRILVGKAKQLPAIESSSIGTLTLTSHAAVGKPSWMIAFLVPFGAGIS